MKRFILAACAGLLAAAMASPSFAADMPGPYVAPAYSPAFNWTGFYAGINGGYAFGKTNWTDTTGATTGDFNFTGALAGGTLGYNIQTGSWVWGFEADGAYSSLKGTDAAACCETKNDWLATARGRFGFAFGQWLPLRHRRRGLRRRQDDGRRLRIGDRDQVRLDRRRRPRIRLHGRLVRQGRISLCRSRQGELRRGRLRSRYRRDLQDQHRAGGRQLPLLARGAFKNLSGAGHRAGPLLSAGAGAAFERSRSRSLFGNTVTQVPLRPRRMDVRYRT